MDNTLVPPQEREGVARNKSYLGQWALLMGCTAGLDGETIRGTPRKIWAKKASKNSISDPKPSGSSHPKKAGSFSNPETDGSPTRVAAMLVGDASRIMI